MTPPAFAQDGGEAYKPPAKGLTVAFAEERGGKVDAAAIATVDRIAEVKGDVASYISFFLSGKKHLSAKRRRMRSVFTFYAVHLSGVMQQEFERDKLRALWPLKAGKTATLKSSLYFGPEKTLKEAKAKLRTPRTLIHRYTVERSEKVKVPAGSFDAFVIRRDWEYRSAGGQLRGGGVERIWLAPSLGWVVRRERVIKAGPRKGFRRVLVAVQVKRPK